jgi:hypothetical protein
MTRADLKQAIFEEDQRILAYEQLDNPHDRERYRAEYIRSDERRTALRRELAALIRTETEDARRQPIARVLQPRTREEVAWQFVWDLGQHAIGLAVEHTIAVVRAVTMWDMASWQVPRRVSCVPILTERAYAAFLHECAHIVEPRADSRQQRHAEIAEKESIVAIVSPLAECTAWLWAVAHCYRNCWTASMHQALIDSLGTYQHRAINEDERRAMATTVAFSFEHIQPAPDSPEGRARKLEQIAQETPGPRLQARLRRVAAIANEQTITEHTRC